MVTGSSAPTGAEVFWPQAASSVVTATSTIPHPAFRPWWCEFITGFLWRG